MTILNFDRGKPFYPFVVNCISSLWGTKELATHGLLAPALRRPGSVTDDMPFLDDAHRQTFVRLHGSPYLEVGHPLKLGRTHGPPLGIDSGRFATELIEEQFYLKVTTYVPLRALVIACYETVKTHRVVEDPLWEFFRHVRNASAHVGSFNFLNDEPKRVARWGSLEVVLALQGKPLFSMPNGTPGFWKAGDVFEMLRDVEVANPNMTA